MSRLQLAACLLLLSSCRPPTPADQTAALKVSVAAGVTACRFYLLNPALPRDAELDVACPLLVQVPP